MGVIVNGQSAYHIGNYMLTSRSFPSGLCGPQLEFSCIEVLRITPPGSYE